MQFLKEQEVSAMLQIAVQTLKNWRSQKKGPPYVRLSTAIRYPTDLLQKYLDKNTFNTNSIKDQGDR